MTPKKESTPKPGKEKLSISQYLALKAKNAKKDQLDSSIPLQVKIFLFFPILIFIIFFCLGILFIPQIHKMRAIPVSNQTK